MKNNSIVDCFILMVLLSYPVLLFAIKGGMNASLFILAALCIYLLFKRGRETPTIDRESLWFSVAMSSLLAAILISQAYHQEFIARTYDSPSRFLLAVPIFFALRKGGFRLQRAVQFGFPLGAITALLFIVFGANFLGSSRAGLYFMNEIHFGDMTLMLGILSLLSINWEGKDSIPVWSLKISGLFAGLVASIMSGSRGGWIAIPFFLLIWFLFRNTGRLGVKLVTAVVASALLALISYFFVDAIHIRLNEIYADLAAFSQGNADTSVGIRLQLWKAALRLFVENPVFGVGAEGFGRAMDGMSATGFITPMAAELGKGEVHSEILANAVRFGIFGLLSILAVYFVPFFIFLRAARSDDHQRRGAAMMGMCLTLGFFVFGLTAEIFILKMTAAFYSLTVAVLLAAATNNLKSSPNHTTT